MDENYLDQFHFSPLHKAILGLSSQSPEESMARCADDLDSVDYLGNTALSWAIQRNDIAAARVLLNVGANPNIQNSVGNPALHYASRYSTLSCVKLLVDTGSDPHLLNHYGQNALHALTWQGSRNLLEKRALVSYLIAVDTDVNQRDIWGATPLGSAAHYNRPIIAAALLDVGADINSQDSDGDSILHNALHFNSEDVIQFTAKSRC